MWQSSVQIYMRCLYYCIRLLACYVSRERALPGSVFQKLRVKVGRILQSEPLVTIYYSLIVCSMLLLDGLGFPWLSCYFSIGYSTPTITSDLKPIARSRDVEVVLAHSTYSTFNKTTLQVKTTLFTTSEEYTYCRIHCDVIESSTGFFFITYEI